MHDYSVVDSFYSARSHPTTTPCIIVINFPSTRTVGAACLVTEFHCHKDVYVHPLIPVHRFHPFNFRFPFIAQLNITLLVTASSRLPHQTHSIHKLLCRKNLCPVSVCPTNHPQSLIHSLTSPVHCPRSLPFRCRWIVLSSVFHCPFSHVEVYADFKVVPANQHDGASATRRSWLFAHQLIIGHGDNDAERECHNK